MTHLEEAIEEALASLDDGFQIEDLWDIASNVMENVEEWEELATGQDRKDFVLQVLDGVCDRVDLPGPDWFTKKVLMWLLPGLIDKFVDIAKTVPTFGD